MQFSSSAQLREHYRSVQERLHGPRVPPRYVKVRKPPIIEEAPPEHVSWSATTVEYDIKPPFETFTFTAPPRPKPIQWLNVLEIVCKYYKVSRNDIISPRRQASFCHARHMLMFLLREYTQMSMPALGRHLRRDHTTILHGIRKMEQQIANDPNVLREYAALSEILGAADGS